MKQVRGRRTATAAWAITLVVATAPGACIPPGKTVQRLSIATGGTGGVNYPYGGAIAKVISDRLDGVEATAEVTGGSVDNLKFIANDSADLGFVVADALADAYVGQGAFADFGLVPARTLAVLYDSYIHIVTMEDIGIEAVTDLNGRIVSTGAAGSGTEASALRLLAAAGVDLATVNRQRLGVGQSVDALKDGKIEAFFWSGGIPAGSVLDLAATPGRTIRLLASETLLPWLQRDHELVGYHAANVPQSTYPGMAEDIQVVAVSNILVAHESMDPQLARHVMEAIFAGHDDLIATHPMAGVLSHDTAVIGSPIPFHQGAIDYYRERGVWNESFATDTVHSIDNVVTP